jgi:SagB-type dehydrogenase family enzyme
MRYVWVLMVLLAVIVLLPSGCVSVVELPPGGDVVLPEPQKNSGTSIEEALLGRKSVRSFSDKEVTLEQIGQLCWAAQGITHGTGRTAPSAGAIYPLTLYVVTGRVSGQNVSGSVYRYDPQNHKLIRIMDGDRRLALSSAAMGQASVKQAAVDFVITGKYEMVKAKFGDKGEMFTHLEAGHAAENICLQAVGLNLGVVTVGAFDGAAVSRALSLPEDETTLYIIPVGNY